MIMQQAAAEMHRVLASTPLSSSADLGWTHLLAQRWRHGDLHDRTSAMSEHVVMAYMSDCGSIERHAGGARHSTRMRHGTMTVIPSGYEAYWDLEGPVDIVHAYIAPQVLQGFADEHDLRGGNVAESLGIEDWAGSQVLGLLASELSDSKAGSQLFTDHLCGLLCLHLLRRHCRSSNDQPSPDQKVRGLAPWQLARTTDFMISRLGREHSLAELAGQVGLSAFHFSRMFSRAMGVSPHRWLISKRIEKAKELLRNTAQPVASIAAAVGYDDPSYFARLFRREVGVAPLLFRRTCRL
jgi:AraC family transcriptional regulator